MAAPVRMGDKCTGHLPKRKPPPRPVKQWSGDVYVEGRNVVRKGDLWVKHGGEKKPSPLVVGSSRVSVNGRQCGRHYGLISCGSYAAATAKRTTVG